MIKKFLLSVTSPSSAERETSNRHPVISPVVVRNDKEKGGRKRRNRERMKRDNGQDRRKSERGKEMNKREG